jgi:hypothetical protein
MYRTMSKKAMMVMGLRYIEERNKGNRDFRVPHRKFYIRSSTKIIRDAAKSVASVPFREIPLLLNKPSVDDLRKSMFRYRLRVGL